MSAHRSQHSMVRLLGTLLPRLLFLAGPVALGACGSGDAPLAPDATPAGQIDAARRHVPKGQILFVWDTNSAGSKTDIYVAGGSTITRLTSTPEREADPAWSWDNKQIAFTRERLDDVSNTGVHMDVYLMNADGSGGRWLTPAPVSHNRYHPTWSPDGTRIVVSGGNYLEAIDLATGAAQFLNQGSGGVLGQGATFSPTGGKILLAWGTEVFTVNPDGTGKTVLETGAAGSVSQLPAYSPTGNKVAFASNRSGDSEIYVMNADGTGLSQLTKSAGDDSGPTWSPDGKRISFWSTRTGRAQIWSMGASGGNPTQLSPSGYWQASPAYSH